MLKENNNTSKCRWEYTSPSVKRVALSAMQAKEPSACLSITCQGPAKLCQDIYVHVVEFFKMSVTGKKRSSSTIRSDNHI